MVNLIPLNMPQIKGKRQGKPNLHPLKEIWVKEKLLNLSPPELLIFWAIAVLEKSTQSPYSKSKG